MELIAELPDENVQVLGDNWNLTMMVGNLTSNAIKYSEAGQQVRVSLVSVGHSCRLSVSDTGRGIAEDEQDRIFERFYRIDPSRNRSNGGGTGLGLSIVKEVARQLGGYVHVSSSPGQGSVFTVSLPQYIPGSVEQDG